ncbi:PRTRC system protein E [Pseudoduganella sp. SL102]|uniref:PRTRC system protein E n=1 Tax=Pseudoduganella sp. SL102 TaxID=2995154 RepID=UPI00248D0787|nr:PRTRC system protein E [Pseudoduganella sp. SL102]WBS00129.1 PRTRC system protein E [Pseudoduganella sp. SL102]
MGMFTELYPLAVTTRLAMLVSADAERRVMTISVMPRPTQDATAKLATDLTLTATPEDFDAGFIEALTGYRVKLVPLLEQAAAAGRAIEAAHVNPPKQPKAADKPAKATAPPKPSAPCAAPRIAAADGENDAVEDTNPNNDPDRDWMKNRQPELF